MSHDGIETTRERMSTSSLHAEVFRHRDLMFPMYVQANGFGHQPFTALSVRGEQVVQVPFGCNG